MTDSTAAGHCRGRAGPSRSSESGSPRSVLGAFWGRAYGRQGEVTGAMGIDAAYYRNDQELFSVEPQQSLRYKGKLGVGTYYRNRAYFDDLMVTRLHSTTGMGNISGVEFSIYPNPSKDLLNVEYEGGLKSVIILNMLGQRIKQFENMDSQRMNINISDLEQGIYMIRLTSNDDSTGLGRFVKQ